MTNLLCKCLTSLCLTFLCFGAIAAQDSIYWAQQAADLIGKIDKVNLSPEQNLALVEEALIYYEKAGDWSNQANCYNRMAVHYYNQEDFKSAGEAAAAVLKLAKQKNSLRTDKAYLSALGNMSVIFFNKGDYQKAIALSEEVIEGKKKKGVKPLSLATNYHNAGYFYRSYGDHNEAIRFFSEAIRIRAEATDLSPEAAQANRSDMAISYAARGQCQLLLEDYAAAKEGFEAALQLIAGLPKDSEYVKNAYFYSLVGLAEIALKKGEHQLCYDYARQAKTINDQFQVSDDYLAYKTIGQFFEAIGADLKALDYYETAVEAAIEEAAGIDQYPQVAESILAKAGFLVKQERFTEALCSYQEGLQYISRSFTTEDIYNNPQLEQLVQQSLALDLLQAKGDAFFAWYQKGANDHLKNAYQNYQLAAELTARLRPDFVSEPAKQSFAQKASTIFDKAIQTAWLLYQQEEKDSYLRDIFTYAEGNKAIILLESMNDELAMQYGQLPDSVLAKDKELYGDINYLQRKIAKAKEDTVLIDLEQRLFALREEQSFFIQDLEKQYPKYYQLKYQRPGASLQDLQAKLAKSQEGLVEFFVGKEQAFAIVLSADQLRVHPIPDWVNLSEDIQMIRQIISQEPQTANFVEQYQDFVTAAHRLYQSLLAPSLTDLPSTLNHLTIIPDDLLCFLPFELLLTQAADSERADYRPNNLAYLLEQYAISYHFSAQLLTYNQNQHATKKRKSFIGFAPAFPENSMAQNRACNSLQLANLPCASQEVETVQALMGGDLQLQYEANLNSFGIAQDYQIIHLATHACIDEANPNENRIFFSDAPLSSSELYQFDLSADLIVLSACNTGAGQLVKGEGVMSLSRSFIQAGCKSSLTSLWSVNDCSTADLMALFYEELKKGKCKDRALGAAKTAYLAKSQDPAAAHPFYWAAFVMFGDDSPIGMESKEWYWWLGIGLVLLLFVLYRYLGPSHTPALRQAEP